GFLLTSPDSAEILVNGAQVEVWRYTEPVVPGDFKITSSDSKEQCDGADFEVNASPGFDGVSPSAIFQCTPRKGAGVSQFFYAGLRQDEPGRPYYVVVESRPRFVQWMRDACGTCFDIRDNDMERIGFEYDTFAPSLVANVGGKRMYFEWQAFR
ncbi:hypothetical protein FOZ63_013138, partial [Perkinsus olseni]